MPRHLPRIEWPSVGNGRIRTSPPPPDRAFLPRRPASPAKRKKMSDEAHAQRASDMRMSQTDKFSPGGRPTEILAGSGSCPDAGGLSGGIRRQPAARDAPARNATDQRCQTASPPNRVRGGPHATQAQAAPSVGNYSGDVKWARGAVLS